MSVRDESKDRSKSGGALKESRQLPIPAALPSPPRVGVLDAVREKETVFLQPLVEGIASGGKASTLALALQVVSAVHAMNLEGASPERIVVFVDEEDLRLFDHGSFSKFEWVFNPPKPVRGCYKGRTVVNGRRDVTWAKYPDAQVWYEVGASEDPNDTQFTCVERKCLYKVGDAPVPGMQDAYVPYPETGQWWYLRWFHRLLNVAGWYQKVRVPSSLVATLTRTYATSIPASARNVASAASSTVRSALSGLIDRGTAEALSASILQTEVKRSAEFVRHVTRGGRGDAETAMHRTRLTSPEAYTFEYRRWIGVALAMLPLLTTCFLMFLPVYGVTTFTVASAQWGYAAATSVSEEAWYAIAAVAAVFVPALLAMILGAGWMWRERGRLKQFRPGLERFLTHQPKVVQYGTLLLWYPILRAWPSRCACGHVHRVAVTSKVIYSNAEFRLTAPDGSVKKYSGPAILELAKEIDKLPCSEKKGMDGYKLSSVGVSGQFNYANCIHNMFVALVTRAFVPKLGGQVDHAAFAGMTKAEALKASLKFPSVPTDDALKHFYETMRAAIDKGFKPADFKAMGDAHRDPTITRDLERRAAQYEALFASAEYRDAVESYIAMVKWNELNVFKESAETHFKSRVISMMPESMRFEVHAAHTLWAKGLLKGLASAAESQGVKLVVASGLSRRAIAETMGKVLEGKISSKYNVVAVIGGDDCALAYRPRTNVPWRLINADCASMDGSEDVNYHHMYWTFFSIRVSSLTATVEKYLSLIHDFTTTFRTKVGDETFILGATSKGQPGGENAPPWAARLPGFGGFMPSGRFDTSALNTFQLGVVVLRFAASLRAKPTAVPAGVMQMLDDAYREGGYVPELEWATAATWEFYSSRLRHVRFRDAAGVPTGLGYTLVPKLARALFKSGSTQHWSARTTIEEHRNLAERALGLRLMCSDMPIAAEFDAIHRANLCRLESLAPQVARDPARFDDVVYNLWEQRGLVSEGDAPDIIRDASGEPTASWVYGDNSELDREVYHRWDEAVDEAGQLRTVLCDDPRPAVVVGGAIHSLLVQDMNCRRDYAKGLPADELDTFAHCHPAPAGGQWAAPV